MYKLRVTSEFSAAHNLREYKGKCEALHGHNWKVEVVIAAKNANKQGLVVDFHEIKRMIKAVLEELDHAYLNELKYFKKYNPTSENLAKYIFDEINAQITSKKFRLQEVTVWESDQCSATYYK